MASIRFTDVQVRPTEFLDLTSLTLDEFQLLVPPFESAFQAHMREWRLDGQPRTARRFTVYKNCPLATPEDRLFFILVYLKTYALQVVQGRLFGMGQSKANQWIHVLLPALLTAVRTLPEATPYPLPAGSRLLQDLGFLAFPLPQVEILMPMKKPHGQELTLEQQRANQALHQRRLRIEHVNSSVKRCRIVKDRIRLWKEGVRDLVVELCCALHNFRVRLAPWQPMI